jgi:hypothetical protein
MKLQTCYKFRLGPRIYTDPFAPTIYTFYLGWRYISWWRH